ncbi:putative MFS family arabinose efflux permease [Sporosarcina luteola]|nr:putative MFS family arabinose efflux permease [Sporosarcina luteola]
MIGYLNLEDTLIMTLAAGLMLKITKNATEKTILMVGLVLFITGYVILSYLIHPISLVIGMLLISVGFLVYRPVEQTIIANSIPEHSRGKHLSILGLMRAFGGMISSLFIWGMEYISEIGISIIFLCIGIVIFFNYLKVLKHANIKRILSNER